MTPEENRLVKSSFARIFRAKGKVSKVFYEELFRRAPGLRPLFPEGLGLQQEKLNDTLATLVRQIEDPQTFCQMIEKLARSHAGYGALPEHLPLVGEVLIHALRETAPGGLSAAEIAAWNRAFTIISSIMGPALSEEIALRAKRAESLPSF